MDVRGTKRDASCSTIAFARASQVSSQMLSNVFVSTLAFLTNGVVLC